MRIGSKYCAHGENNTLIFPHEDGDAVGRPTAASIVEGLPEPFSVYEKPMFCSMCHLAPERGSEADGLIRVINYRGGRRPHHYSLVCAEGPYMQWGFEKGGAPFTSAGLQLLVRRDPPPSHARRPPTTSPSPSLRTRSVPSPTPPSRLALMGTHTATPRCEPSPAR